MPKKFYGPNTKAIAAKEKKANIKELQLTKQEQQGDVVKDWVDEAYERKLKKKEEKHQKRDEKLARKNELRELLKKESEHDKGVEKKDSIKKCQQQIQQVFANAIKKNGSSLNFAIAENSNGLSMDEAIARTIDDALSVLSTQEPSFDKHPEKRLKAGHKAYEEKRLKELREAYPKLKLSQLKEIIYKEWQKMQPK